MTPLHFRTFLEKFNSPVSYYFPPTVYTFRKERWLKQNCQHRAKQKAFFSNIFAYSRVSNWRDSPLINYSVFCHPPQSYSVHPVYWFWRILPTSPFILDSLFINSCAQSTAVVWSLGKATKLFDVHVFFISMTFISIYRLRFGDFLCRFQVILHVDKLPLYFWVFLMILSQDRLMILFQWKF